MGGRVGLGTDHLLWCAVPVGGDRTVLTHSHHFRTAATAQAVWLFVLVFTKPTQCCARLVLLVHISGVVCCGWSVQGGELPLLVPLSCKMLPGSLW